MVSGGEGISRIPRVIRGLTIAILILAGTVLAAVNWWESRVSEPYLGGSTEDRLLTVPFGSSVRSIGQLLQGSDIIRSDLIFAAYVRISGPDPLQAGEYLFENPISLTQVVQILREGRVHHYRITIPEGLTMDEVIGRFVQEGLGQQHELEPLTGVRTCWAAWTPRPRTWRATSSPTPITSRVRTRNRRWSRRW